MTYLTLKKVFDLVKETELPYPEKTMKTIFHVADSINKANLYKSKLSLSDPIGGYILGYEGYTGTKTRHFYNNVCSRSGTRYLEIGVYNGSSSMSAIYKNALNALFIDNWCQFNGSSKVFESNINKCRSDNSTYELIESDCWEVDVSKLGKFNVYLYDGDHSEEDHFQALNHYYDCLEDEFVFLVDDYNWPNVRDGTMRALNHLKLDVLFRHEIFISDDDIVNMPQHNGRKTWWNGIGVFVLKKAQ